MFETGDYVVYGHVGICQVKGVTTMNMEGIPRDRLYYVLQPGDKNGSTVYTPVDSMKQVLRPVMTKQEAEQLIEEIPAIDALTIDNDKQRETMYKECLKSCSSKELVRVIKTIYERRRTRMACGKKATAMDERYIKLAEDNLYSELSLLLEVPKSEIPAYISEKIQMS